MNEKGVKMQEKNVQGKKKQEKKVQGNKSQENRIQGKRVQEGKKQGSPKRENKRPESRAVKGVKPEQKQRSEQKQRTEQKQKAAKFGKPVLKQQFGQNVEKGKKNAKKSMCPVMRQCGGCQMLDMPYAEQLKTKRKRLETLLKGICPVKDMIGMEDPFYYRNKVHAVFDRDRRGNIISGIYQENTHNVVPVEKCMIEDQKADEIIGTIRGMLKSFKIRTFDEDTGYGLLRHVLIRRGFESGEIMHWQTGQRPFPVPAYLRSHLHGCRPNAVCHKQQSHGGYLPFPEDTGQNRQMPPAYIPAWDNKIPPLKVLLL